MSAILPFTKIDSASLLANYFTHYQICWIQAEDPFHEAKKQVFALAEKSVRIGWTFCDGFKNVRKRLHHKNRDYLFVTKDWPSALEYMQLAYRFIEFFDFTRCVLNHGEGYLKVHHLDLDGRPTSLTDDLKIGYIKFDNGSRIIAFSSNPYAMTVYGGDVGIDEFAKHPNARLLWQTAQGRITWAGDMAVWSSHDGEDTLFNQFAREARAACAVAGNASLAHPMGEGSGVRASFAINSQPSTINSPWNLYFRVTMPDAIDLGLLDVINRVKGTQFTPEQFLADCRARAGAEEIFQQS